MSLANSGSLADLQRAFQDYVLASSEAFAASVRDTRKADRATLLDVYRDGYALRLIEVLTNDYPGLMAMAGPADFDNLARAYIAAHPSRYASVRWFGQHLADFIAATPPYSRSPAAAEMARFEWLLGEAFDAPDLVPVTAAALMALPPEAWETLCFTPLPSLRRSVFAFEVAQAWQRREEVEAGNLDVAPRRGADAVDDLAARARVQFPLARGGRSHDARRSARRPAFPGALRGSCDPCRRGPGGRPRRRLVTRLGRGRLDRLLQSLESDLPA